MIRNIFFTLITVFFITGCSTTTQVYNLQKNPTQESYEFKIANQDSTELKNNSIDTYFGDQLAMYLEKEGIKKSENSDTIVQSDIIYNKGNRALRYWVGFGAGKASANIETKIINKADNKVITTLNTKASVSMGFFGSDDKSVLDNAAKDIAEKIKQTNIFK